MALPKWIVGVPAMTAPEGPWAGETVSVGMLVLASHVSGRAVTRGRMNYA